MKAGTLVRVKSYEGIRRQGELALILGPAQYQDSYTVRYLSDGKEDWWFADQLETPDEEG